ncbi:probable transcriptional regulator protein, AraC family [Rhizobium etli CFN 42]|uniref:Probable transcriptional regulator protein, AraC family n=1 Tax=Rhizobium etli (strain ATCC 51251 / DSM 11541 / JCM 21823 / NBRC 15573 / CFN 42) TaxID=347834 RepID=Q2K427_RHIEC|nr:AraC family transcriptional regulator [Rhizobium etli]ABC92409.1 probable transcriptional regulator protein, AraC family [Rhizobium etli CFN 42]
MNAIARAIWFIESHFESDISLEEISEAAGLSRYHLSRVFGLVTGHSISSYVRGRRLSRAVPALVSGSSTILEVALCAGYGSHEAFTRAFRDQFGMTPDAVRRQAHARNLVLLEPIRMDTDHLNDLEPPRFETLQPMLFAGLQETYPYGDNAAIPSLWQKFNTHFGHIPGQKGNVAYGICRHIGEEEKFRYMAAAEISDASDLPADFTTLKIAGQRYAVFTHRGHISGISLTMHRIFGTWWPTSGLEHGETPDMLERYDERFDPYTGMGITEIWLPIRA